MRNEIPEHASRHRSGSVPVSFCLKRFFSAIDSFVAAAP